MAEHATIVGHVEYRLGDGPKHEIPKGPVEFELDTTDVSLSWGDAETRESAAIPRSEFSRYVLEEAIQLDADNAPH